MAYLLLATLGINPLNHLPPEAIANQVNLGAGPSTVWSTQSPTPLHQAQAIAQPSGPYSSPQPSTSASAAQESYKAQDIPSYPAFPSGIAPGSAHAPASPDDASDDDMLFEDAQDSRPPWVPRTRWTPSKIQGAIPLGMLSPCYRHR